MAGSAKDSPDRQGSADAPDPRGLLGDLDESQEVDLSSLLDIQVDRVEGEGKQANRLVLKICGALALLLLVAYGVSASMRREVSGLIQNIRESRHDFDAEAKSNEMQEALDKVTAKLASHGTDIDRATRSLGVDPTTVKEDGMDAEMKQMMGGEGRTSGERQRLAENLAHMAGVELPKPSAAAEEPPAETPAAQEEPVEPGAGN